MWDDVITIYLLIYLACRLSYNLPVRIRSTLSKLIMLWQLFQVSTTLKKIFCFLSC